MSDPECLTAGSSGKDSKPAKTPTVPTEAEVVRALDEWELDAAYRKVRHAANVGGCYSTDTIVLAAGTFDNRRLTDDLVCNRLAHGGFDASEMNPAEAGEPSVCEFVSAPVLDRMLEGMRGTFTPEQAWRFVGYHVDECDAETLRLVADRTSFSAAERAEFLEDNYWLADPKLAPGVASPAAAGEGRGKGPPGCRKPWAAMGFLALFAVACGAAFVLALGAVGAVLFLAVIVAFGWMALSSWKPPRADRFPDARSDYNRRVWADDHNYEADGDADHNYEADGDLPW